MIRLALAVLVPLATALAMPEYPAPSSGYLPSSFSHPSTSFVPGGAYSGPSQRQVYFFAAPDDDAEARLRIHIQPSSGSSARAIFIKAPSSGHVVPEVVAPPSHSAERTLVYVLVKKPQHGGAVTLPASLGTRQSKPEVHFVRYTHGHEAGAAVQQSLQGAVVGSPLQELGSHQSFVGALGADGAGTAGLAGTTGAISNGLVGVDQGFNLNSPGGTRYGTPNGSGPYK